MDSIFADLERLGDEAVKEGIRRVTGVEFLGNPGEEMAIVAVLERGARRTDRDGMSLELGTQWGLCMRRPWSMRRIVATTTSGYTSWMRLE